MNNLHRLTSATLAVFVFLISCGIPDETQTSAESRVQYLLEVWESGRTDELHELFHNDAVYDDYPNGVQYNGFDEIAGYIGHVHSWASAIQIETTSIHAGGSSATAEWVMTGVQDRPIGNRVPVATGRSIRVQGVTIIEMSSGKIRRAADYIDTASLMLQLGSRIELPGGAVLELPPESNLSQ